MKRSATECECADKVPTKRAFLIEGPIYGFCCDNCLHVLDWRKATDEEVAEYRANQQIDPNQTKLFDQPDTATISTPGANTGTIEAPAPKEELLGEVNTTFPPVEITPTEATESYLIKDISVLTNPDIIRVFTDIGSFDINTTPQKGVAALNNKALFVGKTGVFNVRTTGPKKVILSILKLV